MPLNALDMSSILIIPVLMIILNEVEELKMRSLDDFFVIEDEERKQIQNKISTYKQSQYIIKEEIKSNKKDFTDEKILM